MAVGRRTFTGGLAATLAATKLGLVPHIAEAATRPYRGPNVIIVRFGGGVRRRETIDPENSFAPFLRHTLTKRGVLIPDVRIAEIDGMDTSHAEGTINILTGRYAAWRDAGSKGLTRKIAPTAPTLFEYFRKAFVVPSHQSLLINGEDRPQEEFYSFGTHRHFGVTYRSDVLSLYRYKIWNLGRKVAQQDGSAEDLAEATKKLAELKQFKPLGHEAVPSGKIENFWSRWRSEYGDTGLVNQRGDRLLTQLALRAMKELRPRLMMINYQDPDYVHWGNASHYTRAIAIIDDGLRQLVTAADTQDHYRRRTVFVVIPDCGRDANPLMDVPFQHHFNTRSAHEIWALIFGPGIEKGRTLDKSIDQSMIAPTVGAAMGFRTGQAEAGPISEIFS